MPKNFTSDMTPASFSFHRKYLGLTTQEIAEQLHVSHRTVQSWDHERNASIPAQQLVLDLTQELNDWVEQQLQEVLNRFAENQGEPVALTTYNSITELQKHHPKFTKISHYEAHLRALAAVLNAKGVKFYIA